MKKLLSLLIVLSCVTGFLYAEKKVSFTVTPDIGVINGKINEFVYYVPNPAGTSGQSSEIRRYSELNWATYWIPYMGSSCGLELGTGLCVDFGFDAGIPMASNAMEDRDWLNCINHIENNYLTNYSIHQNYLLAYYNVDFSMGQKFTLPYGFAVKPELFVTNNYFSFCSVGGWGMYGKNWWYAANYGELAGKAEEGDEVKWTSKVISYEQNRVFLGLGLSAEKAFDFGLSVSLFGKVRFAFVRAEDHHFNTSMVYVDEPYGFGGVLAGGQVSYSFNEKHKISFKGSYDWLPLILGPDYAGSESDSSMDADAHYLGGASSSLMKLSLSYTYSF